MLRSQIDDGDQVLVDQPDTRQEVREGEWLERDHALAVAPGEIHA
jgi:hypothetical protein